MQRMRVVLVPDKFKEALTAQEVCRAIAEGILQQMPLAQLTSFAASDGGNGFLEAVADGKDLIWVSVPSQDPLGRPMVSQYVWDPIQHYAYVEMAQSSGLELLKPHERNPMLTGTFGTGILLRDAISRGAKRVFIGLGGSATNDGGLGIASAFGFSFYDETGNHLAPIGGNLTKISKIEKPDTPILPEGVECIAVNDVNNPLFGSLGAAEIYGPQKGASPEMVMELDRGLRHLAELVQFHLGIDTEKVPGSGAAGGTAYGLQVFLGATFVAGSEFMIEYSGLKHVLAKGQTDLIITGEGQIDDQSLSGKFIQGILKLGAEYGVPVGAVCGSCTLSEEDIQSAGLAWVLEVADVRKSLSWNLKNAYSCTVNAVTAWFDVK